MIITSYLLGIHKEEFTKLYEVSIQFGAILAVVVLYWRKFFEFRRWQFYVKLAIGVLPALILGYLFSDKIDASAGKSNDCCYHYAGRRFYPFVY